MLENLFLLKGLPNLGSNTGYGLLFIFGLLTSFHCIIMCGGIALSQCMKNSFRPSFLYHIGRILSYTLIGGIVGSLGQVISFQGTLKGIVPIIGGIFMIIMGVNLLGIFPLLRRFNIRMPYFFAKKIKDHNTHNPLYIGLLSGLMPCAPLQIIQLYALGTGSILTGALSMFVFALGTVPILFIFSIVNTVINKKYSTKILKASAVLVLFLGIVMIQRGLALTGIPSYTSTAAAVIEPKNTAVIQNHIQTITTTIQSDTYDPIVVQKGIPVKWTIKADAENLNECNNAIVIPKFKIEKSITAGENVVEFTPLETGQFTYTCWMGMIESTITVVDDLKN